MATLDETQPIDSYPGAQSVSRAIALLKAFDDTHPEWNLGDLSGYVSLNKTTVHRLLAALESEGLIVRAAQSGHYRLGAELIRLGGCAMRSNDLRTAARPELESLARESRESVVIEILMGNHTLILDGASNSDPMSISQDIGAKLPVHATSTGKMLLALSPQPEIDKFLSAPLVALTPNTITGPAVLASELEQIRRQGYAQAVGELEVGFVSIAAPVLDQNRTIVGALGIGGPALRLTEERIPDMVASLQVAARRVSRRLGYRPG